VAVILPVMLRGLATPEFGGTMAENTESGSIPEMSITGGRRGRTGRQSNDRGGSRNSPENPSNGPRSARRSGAGTGANVERGRVDLRKDLRDFASGRPQGWGHDDWIRFLEDLQSRGHDIRDREAIGIALEKERLDVALTPLRGMGPQRRAALVERYGTIWNLRNAPVAEIAQTARVPTDLAERVKAELS
jgi:hypothetical protein